MPRSATPAALLLTLAIAGPGALAAEAEPQRYPLPNLDTLALHVPPGWQDTVDQPPGGGPPIIQFRPRAGAAFELYLQVESPDPALARIVDAETLRQQVRDAAERLRPPGAPELALRRLQGTDGLGYYFLAADPEAQGAEFPLLCQGALLAGALVLRFELLTDEGQDAVVAAALAMLQEAAHLATGADQR